MVGLTEEEALETSRVDVWPDNVSACNVFIAMSTQWSVGMSGPVGLIYASIEPMLRMTGVPPEDWAEVFDDLRTMEDAALEQIRKQEK